jgi:hypothetical protein
MIRAGVRLRPGEAHFRLVPAFGAALIPITADRIDSALAEGLGHHAFLTWILAG